MHTLIHCTACRQAMRLPPSYVGKKVQCPQCGVRFTAPAPAVEDIVDVELIEPATAELAPTGAALELPPTRITAPVPAEPELWAEPAREEEVRQAGPLRLPRQPKKPAPKPGRWPIYLFVLALLPLGIPLLALVVDWSRGMEPSANLLLWCGAAVVLAGLCLAIALPGRAAVGVRVAGSLTLSFFAYLASGVILLAAMGSDDVSARDWRPLNAPEDHFTAMLPGGYMRFPAFGPVFEGRPAQGRRYAVRIDRLKADFFIDAFPAPARFQPDQFLGNCRGDLTREYPGSRIIRDGRVVVGGVSGHEFTLQPAPDRHVLVRYLATQQRVYVLTLQSTGRPVSPRTRDRFLQSFNPHPAPIQPIPWVNPPPPVIPPMPNPPPVEPPPAPAVPSHTIDAGGEVRSLALAPDGRTLAVAAEGRGVMFWDTSTGKMRLRTETPVNVTTAVVYAPDGRVVAVGGGADGAITLLNAQTGVKQRVYEPWAGQPVAGFAFSPDGKRLAAATGSADKPLVRVWELATGEGQDVLPRDGTPPGSLRYQGIAFTPDSRQLFVAASQTVPGRPAGRVDAFHDATTGQPARTLNAYRSDRYFKARLLPDGKRVAYFTRDNAVHLWDVAADRETATLRGHQEVVSEVAGSADGRRLASVSRDGIVKLWDLSGHREQASFSIRAGQQWTLGKLAFSADGNTLAAGLGPKVTLWDVGRLTGTRP